MTIIIPDYSEPSNCIMEICEYCGNPVDQYGDTVYEACHYCHIDCEHCGYGYCDQSC